MSLNNILDQPLTSWMKDPGPDNDIVLSSRIRLARNIGVIPFPNRATEEQLNQVVETVKNSVGDLTKETGTAFMFLDLDKISPLERFVLVEKHLISPVHAQEAKHRGLLTGADGVVSIMVNEEDHLRAQVILPGLQLEEAWQVANSVDDILEAKMDFAFSERQGYLTSCPTNVGSGLRASVMLHLPALVITNQIGRVLSAISQLGLAVRGLYGEGSEAIGNIYQISNQMTLGFAEREIVENLQSVAGQIVEQERLARDYLFKNNNEQLADRVFRAYGILSCARIVSSQEAMRLLSDVRLGVDLGIIQEIDPKIFNELLVKTRPNFLQKIAHRDLDAMGRDMMRAEIIRQTIKRQT
ncbi:MAG: protein arginine kinase [Bacillota bacterium]|nr:protein arginine kinase [Bacillota bacterium]HWR55213.1 protein arginine kinase [Negativicutes bacterium]